MGLHAYDKLWTKLTLAFLNLSSTGSLPALEVGDSRLERGTATGLVTIVRDRFAINCVMLVAFYNRADAVTGTGARVADTGDGNAADGEMSRRHARYRAAVTGRVVQADDVRHGRSRSKVALRRIPPTPTWTRPYTWAALP